MLIMLIITVLMMLIITLIMHFLWIFSTCDCDIVCTAYMYYALLQLLLFGEYLFSGS